MSDLKTELTKIQGIGDTTADKILRVIDTENTSSRYLEKAVECAERGEHRKASVFLRRYASE